MAPNQHHLSTCKYCLSEFLEGDAITSVCPECRKDPARNPYGHLGAGIERKGQAFNDRLKRAAERFEHKLKGFDDDEL
jgi:hypothetical protein